MGDAIRNNKMSQSLVNKLLKQALATFSNAHKGVNALKADPKFAENLLELMKLTNSIRKEDLNFDLSLVNQTGRAPVTYIHIFENKAASLGIFILKNSFTLPLHDHPSMFGFIKVIHGKIRVKAYSEIPQDSVQPEVENSETNKRIVPVRLLNEFEATEDSQVASLDPIEGNFHSISSVDGPAAFVDLLAPPYDYDQKTRICRYYKEVFKSPDDSGTNNDNVGFLTEIDEPDDYYCDEAKYRGPDLIP